MTLEVQFLDSYCHYRRHTGNGRIHSFLRALRYEITGVEMPQRTSAWLWIKDAAQGKIYWDDRYLADRIVASILDHTPRRMRSWPVFKRWFYQQEDIERAKHEAERLMELLEE